MPHANHFDKKICELLYGVHEGDTIRITKFDDPYSSKGSYVGKEGVVEHIDDAGQLHGTWGGLAVIPGEDGFVVINHAEVPGKVYLYAFRFEDKRLEIFAGSTEAAKRIYEANYGPGKNPQINLVREATREEYRGMKETGASAPKHTAIWNNVFSKK